VLAHSGHAAQQRLDVQRDRAPLWEACGSHGYGSATPHGASLQAEHSCGQRARAANAGTAHVRVHRSAHQPWSPCHPRSLRAAA
jgi:hypothetical protein